MCWSSAAAALAAGAGEVAVAVAAFLLFLTPICLPDRIL
jgi:hypothetical protein